ncbi:hypothetical protein AB0J86_02005 [Micromonospora sp. NPDC049559]|uniref:hypothetical protein n=1 Tax=Micromonospora sp. NPDC049559 TaxID=3155923 RepID=UPI003444E0BC
MSYDLAVWEGPWPTDEAEGGAVYERLCDKYMEDEEVAPTPRVLAYATALAERWADLTGVETSRWGPMIDSVSGPMIYLTIPYGRSKELSAEAARLAAEHGLVCYDPQWGHLRPADEEHEGVGPSTGHKPV